jgi:hypothetical protein
MNDKKLWFLTNASVVHGMGESKGISYTHLVNGCNGFQSKMLD